MKALVVYYSMYGHVHQMAQVNAFLEESEGLRWNSRS